MTKIIEAYRNYDAPRGIRRSMERMLKRTPKRYLGGLGAVVLTNASGLNRQRRREKTKSRGRKVTIRDSLGLYHHAWDGEPAWIEIFVDNTFERWPPVLFWIPLLIDIELAKLFYHELGHHIHFTQVPEFREEEDVADDWSHRLRRQYLKRTYWWLLALLYVPLKLRGFVSNLRQWRVVKSGAS